MKQIRFLVMLFLLASCSTSPTDVEPSDIYGQDPYVRLLLDANGLKDIPLKEVVKVLDPSDPRRQDWYIDLHGRGIKSFKFTTDVRKLSLFVVVDLHDNEITGIPNGLDLKNWLNIYMDGNKLCNLTPGDSSTLSNNKITASNQKCPLVPPNIGRN